MTSVMHTVAGCLYVECVCMCVHVYSKKNQNAPRPSEHPPVRGKNVKTFRWDHRLQIRNLFMALKLIPLWQ